MDIYEFRTDKDVNFTGALAQNVSASENIALPPQLAGPGGSARNILRAIAVIADQNLNWDVQLFSSSAFSNANLDLDTYIYNVIFTESGQQRDGAGQFYWTRTGLIVPVWDANNTGVVHLSLVNRSAAGKNAGATGEIVIKLFMEPAMYGAGA